MEYELSEAIEAAVKAMEGQEYCGELVSREEAIEVVREIVERALERLA